MLAQSLCSCVHLLCPVQEKELPYLSHHLRCVNFFNSFAMFLRPSMEGYDTDIPFMVEELSIFYLLYNYYLWISVLIALYYKKKLLWWGVRDDLIYGCRDNSLSYVLKLCPSSNVVVVGFLLGPVSHLNSGSWSCHSARYGFQLITWNEIHSRSGQVTLQHSYQWHISEYSLPGTLSSLCSETEH